MNLRVNILGRGKDTVARTRTDATWWVKKSKSKRSCFENSATPEALRRCREGYAGTGSLAEEGVREVLEPVPSTGSSPCVIVK